MIQQTNISVVNELLKGVKQQEIADSYGLTQGRVSQIKEEFQSSIKKDLDKGLIFSGGSLRGRMRLRSMLLRTICCVGI